MYPNKNAFPDGKEIPSPEHDDIQQPANTQPGQERLAQREQAVALLRQIGQAYSAYKQLVEDHPDLAGLKVAGEEEQDRQLYETLRRSLGQADEAPRCMHIKPDGLRCGSPRMKSGELCFSHQRMANTRAMHLRMTLIEDANGVQMALMETIRALIDGQIGHRDAGLLLYGLQTAAANVGKCTFHKSPQQMVTEETPFTAAEQAKARPQTMPEEIDDRYRYANMDPDLRQRMIELGADIDRRDLEKSKAAQVAASVAALAEAGFNLIPSVLLNRALPVNSPKISASASEAPQLPDAVDAEDAAGKAPLPAAPSIAGKPPTSCANATQPSGELDPTILNSQIPVGEFSMCGS